MPIFTNFQDYIQSLVKIEELKPNKIYSAWDRPRSKKEIPEIIRESKSYVEQIKAIVQKKATFTTTTNSLSFCKIVLKELNLDEKLANPLLLESFIACLAN